MQYKYSIIIISGTFVLHNTTRMHTYTRYPVLDGIFSSNKVIKGIVCAVEPFSLFGCNSHCPV